jgi:folate-binding protein YgfZ
MADQPARTIIAVGGADREGFLQDLVTNDVRGLKDGPVYAALLTAQGKYLADFLMVPAPDAIWLDVATPLAEDLARRLTMYRLRRDVAIAPVEVGVATGRGDAPDGSVPDPRDAALGWRLYGRGHGPDLPDELRVERMVPAAGAELVPNESYPLEMGFERLHCVDFRKGCYVGQEVTARMKHKTELRKGLARVRVDGAAAPGTPIERGGRAVGTLHTRAGDMALAYLRFDRAGPDMTAGSAAVALDPS